MINVKNTELLKNEQVQGEINRHRWIESEKAGTDIAFETAARQWLDLYSDGWLAYHKSEAKAAPKRATKKIAKK